MTGTKVILVVVFLLSAAFVRAQNDLSPERIVELTELHESIRGTYQIQLDAVRKQPSIDLLTVEKIDQTRSQTEITFLRLGENVRVLILPKNTINSPDFHPINPISQKYVDEPVY